MTESPPTMAGTTVQLDIGGMTCAACVMTVERTLMRIPGVVGASVNLASEKALVTFDAQQVRPDSFAEPLERAGYHLRTEEVRLGVPGLDEIPVRRRLDELLARTPGVLHIRLNAAANTVSVDLVRGILGADDLMAMLARAGFDASRQRGAQSRQHETRAALVRLAVALVFTVPLWASMVHMMLGQHVHIVMDMILGTIVQWGPGYGFVVRAWANIRRGMANMDVLVAVATVSAWALSVYGVWSRGPVYFDMSATVITVVLLGKYWESLARSKTTASLRQLASLTPRHTRKLAADGTETPVPVEQLMVGDIIFVRPGDRVPVDGRLLDPASLFDESLLTGESIPVRKEAGAIVSQGSIYRGTRSIRLECVRVGKEAALSQIVRVVEQAQAAKPAMQQLADRIAGVFVPIVLGMAVITLVATRDWMRAVAVLVSACPCALGLATPTAIVVASGTGARQGILFRRGDALERASHIDTLLLDKTGTLTRGQPDVVHVEAAGPYPVPTLLQIAAGLERHSAHPLAEAVQRACHDTPAVLDDVYEEPGAGLVGTWQNTPVLFGSPRLLDAYGVPLPERLRDAARESGRDGATTVFLAVDQVVVGALTVTDPIRPNAAREIAALKNLGLTLVMVSGDQNSTAHAVARTLGIDDVRAGLTPQEKAEIVAEWESQGHHAAMVGDGINDAPALARAYLGLAMASGSDIAAETADITLLRPDIAAIGDALRLGRRTVSKIHQNYRWAMIYNAIIIPLAAFGIVSPIIAGTAMAFSSVAVVTNSLTLRRTTHARLP